MTKWTIRGRSDVFGAADWDEGFLRWIATLIVKVKFQSVVISLIWSNSCPLINEYWVVGFKKTST